MTREEAIKIIRKMLAYTDLTVIANLNADMVSACNLAIKALEQEPRWIPVTERYPKSEDEFKCFLVTDDKGKVSVQEFYLSLDDEPQPYFSGMMNVIAWMPLPKAYGEVEE